MSEQRRKMVVVVPVNKSYVKRKNAKRRDFVVKESPGLSADGFALASLSSEVVAQWGRSTRPMNPR